MGRVIIHLLMNESKGYWTDMIVHDPDFIKVTPIPIMGIDPKIDLLPSPQLKAFISSSDPRDVEARKRLPENVLQMIIGNKGIPLDTINTCYIPRKASPSDYVGTSLYSRVINFIALEKALINGTLTAARRQIGPIKHITAGIENLWEPTPREMDDIAALFIQAEEDPVGAVVVTRTGVQLNPLGGGAQQYWKISDDWSFIQEAKMRALGISETFLSAESNYNCCSFDTLITTENGLIKIGEMANREMGDVQDLSLKVAGRFEPERTAKWLYSGKAPTVRVETYHGYELEVTPKHPYLAFRHGDIDWLPAGLLSKGDLVCYQTKRFVRSQPLELGLRDAVQKRGGKRKAATKPEVMTPKLAYYLGAVIAEGCVGARGNHNRVIFYNSDLGYLSKVAEIAEEIFGIKPDIKTVMEAGTELVINGVSTKSVVGEKAVVISSLTVVEWLAELGLQHGPSPDNRSPSYHKVVPWCILEADEASQLAFIASYLEGDGSIDAQGHISFHSRSKDVIKQLQVMLSSHGLFSRSYLREDKNWALELDGINSDTLWSKISPWMVTKSRESYPRKSRYSFGFPREWVDSILTQRKVSSDVNGTIFLNDDGKETIVRSWSQSVPQDKMFLYDRYERGDYSEFMNKVAVISTNLHAKLKELFRLRYLFTEVTGIEDAGIQDVYDISMENGVEPAFVANGLIVHNTMEHVMSIFMEKVRAHRNYITQKLIVDKILKGLAKMHGFYVRKQAELDHRIRTSTITDEQLDVPTVQFTKHLKPIADENYLAVLEKMEEKGIPVLLREWAAAGGHDLDTSLEGLNSDVELRAKVARYTLRRQKISDIAGPLPGSEEEETDIEKEKAEKDTSPMMFQSRLEKLPIWNSRGEFIAITLQEAASALHEVVRERHTNGHLDSYLVQAKHWNPNKAELFKYLLIRLGITAPTPLNPEIVSDILAWIMKRESKLTPEISRELYFLSKLSGEDDGGSIYLSKMAAKDNLPESQILTGDTGYSRGSPYKVESGI